MKLEEADQTQAWTDWIEHAEDAFIAFNITEDAKRLALIRLYGGKKLKEIMKTLRPAILTDKKEPTYKTMRIALDEYFSEKTNEVFERHKFRMLAQEVGESTHNYVTRLRTQGAKCNFDNYNLDQAIIDQLTEKCTSHKMRRAYLKETDITVQKALQITYTYESTEAQACQMEQGEEGTNVNKVSSKSTKESDDGHTYEFRVTSDDTAEVKVMIVYVPVGMLIDSGENVNLIDGGTFEHIIKIRPNIVLKETNIQPKAYGNIPIPLRGEFFATLSNGSKRVAHKILVTTAKQPRNKDNVCYNRFCKSVRIVGMERMISWSGARIRVNTSALEKVLQKLKENNLTISQHKSVFHIDEVEFHGFTVSKEGIKQTDDKIEAVKRFRRPETVQEVRSFLELTSKRGLMLRGSRIIMPQTLQRRTMQPAHETHLGMVKTKALLRGKVWWPTINKDMEKAIRQCIPCASLDTRKQANPVNMSEMKGLWEVIHVDILNTPHSMTGETPAKLLMGRNIKVKLPQEKLKLRTDNRNKSKLAELKPTEQVLLKQTKKDKLSTNYDPKPWTVSERRGNSAILQRGPKKILCSTSQMRRVPGRCLGGNDGSGDSDTDGSHKTAERTDNIHRNRENNQAANTPRTGTDESRQDGKSEEEPLAARRPRRTIVKPKKYQDGAEDFGTDGSESSGTDEVDDSEMDRETSDEYKPGRSWN
ncbi:pol Retrovirus-related Pol polyprotein from transposon-like 15 [Homarus americanus]|uniref:RNA-directed DNA polymerase n=1 Tax=Homarus americanus TaxID=6706 RepID=A0A8J5TLI2_HOMAM|nr:pol Retrovirus-related Pol polyprotein from transposon-like 15 [Homarus americanus]